MAVGDYRCVEHELRLTPLTFTSDTDYGFPITTVMRTIGECPQDHDIIQIHSSKAERIE